MTFEYQRQHRVELSDPQIKAILSAVVHENHRTITRCRDERLSEESRENERSLLKDLKCVRDKLRRLLPE